jgi:hypothetical protein
MSDQDHLNQAVAALETARAAIEAEIAQLKTDHPNIDFSGLDQVVSELQADVPPPTP